MTPIFKEKHWFLSFKIIDNRGGLHREAIRQMVKAKHMPVNNFDEFWHLIKNSKAHFNFKRKKLQGILPLIVTGPSFKILFQIVISEEVDP